MVGIGFLIYWIVPGIPLIPAFALAAVLSPTDAVALSGIVGEGRIPKKIMGILQGDGHHRAVVVDIVQLVQASAVGGHHGMAAVWPEHHVSYRREVAFIIDQRPVDQGDMQWA